MCRPLSAAATGWTASPCWSASLSRQMGPVVKPWTSRWESGWSTWGCRSTRASSCSMASTTYDSWWVTCSTSSQGSDPLYITLSLPVSTPLHLSFYVTTLLSCPLLVSTLTQPPLSSSTPFLFLPPFPSPLNNSSSLLVQCMTLLRFMVPHWSPLKNMGCHQWQDKWRPKPINFFPTFPIMLIYCTILKPPTCPSIDFSDLQSLNLAPVEIILHKQSSI